MKVQEFPKIILILVDLWKYPKNMLKKIKEVFSYWIELFYCLLYLNIFKLLQHATIVMLRKHWLLALDVINHLLTNLIKDENVSFFADPINWLTWLSHLLNKSWEHKYFETYDIPITTVKPKLTLKFLQTCHLHLWVDPSQQRMFRQTYDTSLHIFLNQNISIIVITLS